MAKGTGDKVRDLLTEVEAEEQPTILESDKAVCKHHHRIERKLDITILAQSFLGDALDSFSGKVESLTEWVQKELTNCRKDLEEKVEKSSKTLHQRVNKVEEAKSNQDIVIGQLIIRAKSWGFIGGTAATLIVGVILLILSKTIG